MVGARVDTCAGSVEAGATALSAEASVVRVAASTGSARKAPSELDATMPHWAAMTPVSRPSNATMPIAAGSDGQRTVRGRADPGRRISIQPRA
jgi:hypothetical protein